MNSSVWLDLCEVPADVSRLFNIEPYDVVCIYAETNVPELTRTVVRAMPTAPNSTGVVRCHPFLWDFLDQALQVSTNSDSNYPSEGDPTFSLCSLQAETLSHLHRNQQSHGWKLSKLTPVDLAEDDDVTIHLSILYLDCNVVDLSSADIAVTLEDRFVMVESIVALSTPSGNCIGLVTRLVDSGNDLDPHKSYRIGLDVLVHLDTSRVPTTNADHHSVTTDFGEGTVQSPGYEDLVARLVALCQIKGPAAPSGILLTGSAGVGKSRVASCVAQRLLMSDNNNSRRVHMLSAQDLLLRASFASETDLVELIVPSSIQEYALVVIDDLNILDSDDSADSVRDHEWLLTRNSLVVALGRLHHHHQADCCVLGIARHAATLPKELTRIHRLEKVVEMPTPTQSQREDILHSLLPQNSSWAESLAANTAGFVAADLCRVCTDATTVARVRSSNHLQWKDLMEAARHTVPSQLSQLDVTKTVAFADTTGEPGEELKVHEWAWQKFGGYEAIKKRIYQTVVVPWRRALSNQEPLIAGLYPPGGVLFHGPPGVGKTMAAGCLAASLGLHVVKVKNCCRRPCLNLDLCAQKLYIYIYCRSVPLMCLINGWAVRKQQSVRCLRGREALLLASYSLTKSMPLQPTGSKVPKTTCQVES